MKKRSHHRKSIHIATRSSPALSWELAGNSFLRIFHYQNNEHHWNKSQQRRRPTRRVLLTYTPHCHVCLLYARNAMLKLSISFNPSGPPDSHHPYLLATTNNPATTKLESTMARSCRGLEGLRGCFSLGKIQRKTKQKMQSVFGLELRQTALRLGVFS